MNISFKATQTELTAEIKDYAERKVEDVAKLLNGDRETAICDIELAHSRPQQTGPVFYAEVNLQAGGSLYRATAEEESFEAALDKVKDELFKEIKRDKEKKKDAVRKGGAVAKDMLRGE